jgi:5-methylcytosine-specific restriction endonuclease McrA
MRMPYSTARWQKIREAQLLKQPLCFYCQQLGKIKPATVADHIIPHKGDMHKFWYGELQSLCKHCHDSIKAKQENGKEMPVIGLDGWNI